MRARNIRLGLAALAAALLLMTGTNPSARAQEGTEIAPMALQKDEPIEITSDALDVDQDAQTAIFDGNVDAIQGQMRLKAARIVVFYEQAPAPADAAAPAAEPVDPAETAELDPLDPEATGAKIRQMDALGGVHVSSPTETATGDEGTYDVVTGKIVLVGNVVLTRGKNVIRGTRLSMDVESGKTVVVGNSSGDGGKGRVRSLFVPKKQEADATGAPGTPSPSAPATPAP